MLNRRNFFSNSLKSLGGAMAAGSVIAKTCQSVLTPPQTEGPFYPIQDQKDKDWDLTQVQGKTGKARGEAVLLAGIVQDELCRPVKNALVEIWQACDTGKYNHPSDPNPAKLDPNFQYWGRATTNEKGEFLFKTIKPGAYPATSEWVRPPHIHMKVHLRGFEELTTQIYFKEDVDLLKKDRILQSLNKKERDSVIVDFKNKGSLRKGTCAITLKSF